MGHWNGQPWFTATRITRTCMSYCVATRLEDPFVSIDSTCNTESGVTPKAPARSSWATGPAWTGRRPSGREVSQAPFTSLDRVLAQAKSPDAKPGSRFEVSRRPDAPELSESGRAREQRLVARLHYLTDAGLAQPTAPLTWSVDADFERTLRAFQRAQDRQRMMAQHAAFLSDPRLQYRVVSPHAGTDIVGRVIAHVLDDISDRPHVLIEGIDGVVYYVPHDASIAEARANGILSTKRMPHEHRRPDFLK